MPDLGTLEEYLAGARVDPAVRALRPDYRALLVAVDGLVPGPSGDAGDLIARLTERGPGVRAARRLIGADATLLYRR